MEITVDGKGCKVICPKIKPRKHKSIEPRPSLLQHVYTIGRKIPCLFIRVRTFLHLSVLLHFCSVPHGVTAYM